MYAAFEEKILIVENSILCIIVKDDECFMKKIFDAV